MVGMQSQSVIDAFALTAISLHCGAFPFIRACPKGRNSSGNWFDFRMAAINPYVGL